RLADAYYNRGVAKRSKGDTDGAMADCTRALDIDPKHYKAYYIRGTLKRAAGNAQGAINDFTEAITIEPKLALAYDARGSAKKSLGDTEGAMADYNRTLDLSPKLPQAYRSRGVLEALAHDWPNALADFRHDLEFASADEDGAAYLYIWLIRIQSKETKEVDAAAQELSAALEKRPKSGDWVSTIGRYLLGKTSEGDLFTQANSVPAERRKDARSQAWFYAAMKKLLAGEQQPAAEYFRRCVALEQKTLLEYDFARAALKDLGP
ncbi:MAG TPA: tetratricopeptide repeat protein, partial [Chthoniobacteraceae bacterium]